MEVLSKHRGGLNAIARALLDNEIIDGAEVARLVDEAHGSPVHGEGVKSVPHFNEAAIAAPAPNGAVGATPVANGSSTGNGDGPPGSGSDVGGGPVTVPAAPAPPAAGSDPETWAPPAWPPPDPSTRAPEGPAGR